MTSSASAGTSNGTLCASMTSNGDRLIPEATLPARPVEEPLPEKVQPAPEPPKDWNLPGKDAKTVAPQPVFGALCLREIGALTHQ